MVALLYKENKAKRKRTGHFLRGMTVAFSLFSQILGSLVILLGFLFGRPQVFLNEMGQSGLEVINAQNCF